MMGLHRFCIFIWICCAFGGITHSSAALNTSDISLKLDSLLSSSERPLTEEKALEAYGLLISIYQNGDLETALQKAESLLPYLHHAQPNLHAGTLVFIGNMQISLGLYKAAIQTLEKTLPYYGKNAMHRELAMVLGNISTIYYYLEQFDKSIDYAEQSIDEMQAGSDIISTPYINIANCYSELNQRPKALEWYQKALTIDSANQDTFGISIIHCNIGSLYSDMGQTRKGLPHLQKALLIDSVHQHNAELVGTTLYLGQAYLAMDNMALAHFYLQKSARLSERTHIDQFQPQLYKSLIRLFTRTDKHEKVDSMLQKLTAYHDSLLVQNREKAIIEAENDFNRTKSKLEKELLQQQNAIRMARKNRSILVISLIGAFILVLATLAFWAFRRQKKWYDTLSTNSLQLHNQNHKLEIAMEEQANLTSIVAHDLMTPIASIKGIIELYKHSKPDETEHQKYLNTIANLSDNAQQLIQSISLVNRLEGEQLNALASARIDSLLQEVIDEFATLARVKSQSISSHIEPVNAQTHAEYFKHIGRNLISNALKYSPEGSTISVTLSAKAPEYYTLEIRDQGPGFSQKDQQQLFSKFTKLSARPTGGEHSTGLGLYAVKMLTDRLKGTISLQTSTAGSTFTLRFPIAIR